MRFTSHYDVNISNYIEGLTTHPYSSAITSKIPATSLHSPDSVNFSNTPSRYYHIFALFPTPRAFMAPFVYTGAGRNGSPHLSKAQSFCVKEACLIQKCLARNGSREEKCKDWILFWEKCVERHDKRLTKLSQTEEGKT